MVWADEGAMVLTAGAGVAMKVVSKAPSGAGVVVEGADAKPSVAFRERDRIPDLENGTSLSGQEQVASAKFENQTAEIHLGSQVGSSRKDGNSLFNPTGGKVNCVDSVCAFLNTIKTKSLHTAIPDSLVPDNGGRIHVVLDQIAEKTGVYFGKRPVQVNDLKTARDRQFFVVFDGTSATNSSHVAIGIANKGHKTIFDPQSGVTHKDLSKFGSGKFVAYPLLLERPTIK
jgi:hypothetical protein